MVRPLRVDDCAQHTLLRLIQRREQLGSTGIGRGVAVPHCQSLAVSRLWLAFGRLRTGIEYDAIDRRPVTSLFLIAAPPREVTNQYLAVLARIAQLVKEPDPPDRLARLETVDHFSGYSINEPDESLPLNRGRRLRADIVDDPIDPPHLIGDPI